MSRALPLPQGTRNPEFRSVHDVQLYVETIAGLATRGELAAPLASLAYQGAGLALRALELQLEGRIAKMELVLDVQKAGGFS